MVVGKEVGAGRASVRVRVRHAEAQARGERCQGGIVAGGVGEEGEDEALVPVGGDGWGEGSRIHVYYERGPTMIMSISRIPKRFPRASPLDMNAEART